MTDPDPIVATQLWLERAVIGLNLCPFAKAVHAKRQVRFVLCEATEVDALRETLMAAVCKKCSPSGLALAASAELEFPALET